MQMKRIASLLLAAMLLTLWQSALSSSAAADSSVAPAAAYADGIAEAKLPYTQELKLQGSYASQTSYFNLGSHWEVQEAVLHLIVRVSRQASGSSLTVEVNGQPLYSAPLTGYGENGRELAVSVPAGTLHAGSNEVGLWLGSESPDGIGRCLDDSDRGNWLTVDKDSWLGVDYRTELASMELSQFPYPFLEDAEDRSGAGTTIMLPDAPDSEETAAALQIAAALGADAPDGLTGLYVGRHAEIVSGEHRGDHLIYVGRIADLPEELRAAAPQDALSRLDSGPVLFRSVSPYDSHRILMAVVSGEGSSTLDTAARLLQNPDLVSQLHDSAAVIPAGTDVSRTSSSTSSQSWTLEQLGYSGGMEVRGPLRQQTSFDISLPSNKLIVPGARGKFQLRYARNLDFDKSLVTLYVNGIPAGSKKLDAAKADGDTWEVNIPSRAAQSNYLQFSLAFDLQMKDLSCNMPGEQTPWAYVESSSTIELPSKDERAMLLEHYPWPFIKNGKWNDTVFVTPVSPNAEDYSLLGRIASYLGRYLTDNSASLHVNQEEQWKPSADNNSNVIAAGSPDKLPAIRELNSKLWFQYDDSFHYFLSNEKRRLLPDFSKELASLQLIPSPVDSDHGILVLTAPRQENLFDAEKFLTESRYASSMIGNALLVNRWGEATNHAFSGDDSYSLTEKVTLSTGPARLFIVIFGTVFVLLVLGLLYYWRRNRRR